MKSILSFILAFTTTCQPALAGVVDGQPVNAATTNAAFMDKNSNTFTTGTTNFQNTANGGVGSGSLFSSGGGYIAKNWLIGGNLQLLGSSSGGVTFQAASSGSSYSLNLPNAQGGNGTTLQNDGSGNLTWQLGGSGAGTKNYLGVINGSNNNGNFETGTTSGWSLATTALSSTTPITVTTPGLAYANSYSVFTVSSANATVGATYTNNGNTFTVAATISGSTNLVCTGTGVLTGSTLTKSGGTGDATITFSARVITNASANLTLSTVSSGQLAGSYSGSVASSTTSVGGDMLLSNAWTIDSEDKAKVLTFKIYYNAHFGGNNLTWSGTSTNSYTIWIYDVTNGAWIQPAGVYGMTQSSGTGYVTGTFQTTSNSTQYQLAIMNTTASISAFTMYFDDIFVGPQTAPIGLPGTDPVSFTPTGTWTTNTTYSGNWYRVGKYMWIDVQVALTGAPTSTSLAINIPSGYTIDTSAIANSATEALGWASGRTSTNFNMQALYSTSTSVQIVYQNATTGAQASVNATSPVTWANGNSIQALFKVPILGWSSNVQMSSDTDTRVVAFNATSITGNLTSSQATISYGAANVDTHGGWNGSTTYTIPVTGNYDIDFSYEGITPSSAYAGTCEIILVKNGSGFFTRAMAMNEGGMGASNNVPVSAHVNVNTIAGDTWLVQAICNNSYSTHAFAANGGIFSVVRRSGPSVVASTETVAARYTDTSGAVYTRNAWSVAAYPTKDFDTHGAFSSNTTFTAPVSGTYLFTASIEISGAASNTRNMIRFKKNGTVFAHGSNSIGEGDPYAGSNTMAEGVGLIHLLAGDTVDAEYWFDDGTANRNASTTAGANVFTALRVGN